MRKVSVFAFSFAILSTFALSAAPASARTVNIGGTHSKGDILAHCNAAGGQFSSGLKGGGYSCVNTASGGGAVYCTSKGKCKGYTRTTSHPSLNNILRIGSKPPISTTSQNKPTGKKPLRNTSNIKPIEQKHVTSHTTYSTSHTKH
jgi:hypothetical protein